MVAAIEQSEVRFAGDNLFERFARVAKANVNKAMQETCWYTFLGDDASGYSVQRMNTT